MLEITVNIQNTEIPNELEITDNIQNIEVPSQLDNTTQNDINITPVLSNELIQNESNNNIENQNNENIETLTL